MEPQASCGVSISALQALMASGGVDAQTLDLGVNLPHYALHDHVQKALVCPAAPLALSGASWVPDGVDRISRLPDVVLHNIVSRLTAKDAARTAAIASRWRPLWLSAPLTLVDDHLLPDGGEWNITATVSRVLAAHPGPFRCVHLTCSNMDEHRNELERWLVLLAAKGVQELIFVNRPLPVDLCLPATLFSCASLTRLCLGIWKLPDTAAVPRAATFLNLRELLLSFTVMEDRDLAFMLERSPVLEILTIVGSQSGAPARLRLVSHSLRCVQLGLTRLEEIHVMDTPNLERLLQWNAVGKHHVSSILPGKKGRSRIKIGHAPKLRLLGYLEPGDDEIEISNTVIVAGTRENIVPSVKILAIRVKFGVRNAPKKVPAYLRCFPNLETLHVQSEKHVEPTGKVNFKFWQEGGPIKCVLQTMKKVFFYEFRGSRSEVAFLKFIAERAHVLEKMVIMVASECFSSGDDVSPKLRPLVSAKWISKVCKVKLCRSPFSEGGDPGFSHWLATDLSCPDPFGQVNYQEPL